MITAMDLAVDTIMEHAGDTTMEHAGDKTMEHAGEAWLLSFVGAYIIMRQLHVTNLTAFVGIATLEIFLSWEYTIML